mgnify:FL=1
MFLRDCSYLNLYKVCLLFAFMGRLHWDSYAKEEGKSIEEYIDGRLGNEGNFLYFWDHETFSSLYDEGLIGEGAVVRTSDDGYIDRVYLLNTEGDFLGTHFGAYPLEDRVYYFDEVFESRNISDGYTLEWKKFENLFLKWRKLNNKK